MEASGEELERFFSAVMPHLNEVQPRVVAGRARELGRGGKTAVAEASGLSRLTVIKAQAEVEAGIALSARLRAAVTGLIAIGDAHAFTEPRLGRGMLTALKQAVALRDTLRMHLADGPAAIAIAWDDAFERELGPLLRATNSPGRTFAKDVRSCMSDNGRTFEPTDRGLVLNRAFLNAVRVDARAGRWLLDVGGAEILPAELFAQPGVLERILELGDHDRMEQRAGPSSTLDSYTPFSKPTNHQHPSRYDAR